MYRLDNLLEQWAMAYKPLSHKPKKEDKHKAFYRISMIDGNSEFIRNANSCASPAMSYIAHIDAKVADQNMSIINYSHIIFIMVKQANAELAKNLATDEDRAAEARFEADGIVQDLLAYLSVFKAIASGKSLSQEMQQVMTAVSETPDAPEAGWTIQDGRITMTKEMREAMRGLQLEQANWNTLPTKLNGWQVCGLTIEQVQPRRMCVVPSQYTE